MKLPNDLKEQITQELIDELHEDKEYCWCHICFQLYPENVENIKKYSGINEEMLGPEELPKNELHEDLIHFCSYLYDSYTYSYYIIDN